MLSTLIRSVAIASSNGAFTRSTFIASDRVNRRRFSTKSHRVLNFSAGPACLPDEVMERAANEFTNWGDSGMGFMEMSHRDVNGPVQNTINSAVNRLRSLLSIPSNYQVLFFQGGAHAQFASLPMNISNGGSYAYVETGWWSQRAFGEAQRLFDQPPNSVYWAASAAPSSFKSLPDLSSWSFKPNTSYVHICANETIHGLEYLEDPSLPEGAPLLVGDFTSTLLSRPVDISKYGVIYASSGKNLGPAGVCIAIVRSDLLESPPHPMTPSVLDYRKMATSQPISNIYNTPPTFLIYMMDLLLEWTQKQGGLDAMRDRAESLSQQVYDEIDHSNGFYSNNVHGAHRSRMNVPFRVGSGGGDATLERKFVADAERSGLFQLCGHPLFGGIRVTLYNGVPSRGVDRVIEFMRKFRSQNS